MTKPREWLTRVAQTKDRDLGRLCAQYNKDSATTVAKLPGFLATVRQALEKLGLPTETQVESITSEKRAITQLLSEQGLETKGTVETDFVDPLAHIYVLVANLHQGEIILLTDEDKDASPSGEEEDDPTTEFPGIEP